LNGEFYLQVPVPIRIYLEFAFSDPLGIVFDDALDFKLVFDLELLQSDPD
jgi:hypothetical protein